MQLRGWRPKIGRRQTVKDFLESKTTEVLRIGGKEFSRLTPATLKLTLLATATRETKPSRFPGETLVFPGETLVFLGATFLST